MSHLSDALAANKAKVYSLLTFRAAPAGLVSVKGISGAHRVTNSTSTGAWCVKQSDGADHGPSRWYASARLSPAAQ